MKCIKFIKLGFYYLSFFLFFARICTFIQLLFSCFFIVDFYDIIILNFVKYLHSIDRVNHVQANGATGDSHCK